MSPRVSCKRTALVALALTALSQPLDGQTPLPKPIIGTPTVIAGPSSLSATSPTKAHVFLTWPAVSGAAGYRITRIENTGDPEAPVAEGSRSWFVFEGYTCTAGTSQPYCIFDDVTKVGSRLKPLSDVSVLDPAQPSGIVYPHSVQSGKLYTYRVWSVFPGPVLSPPSPPATVQVK